MKNQAGTRHRTNPDFAIRIVALEESLEQRGHLQHIDRRGKHDQVRVADLVHDLFEIVLLTMHAAIVCRPLAVLTHAATADGLLRKVNHFAACATAGGPLEQMINQQLVDARLLTQGAVDCQNSHESALAIDQ